MKHIDAARSSANPNKISVFLRCILSTLLNKKNDSFFHLDMCAKCLEQAWLRLTRISKVRKRLMIGHGANCFFSSFPFIFFFLFLYSKSFNRKITSRTTKYNPNEIAQPLLTQRNLQTSAYAIVNGFTNKIYNLKYVYVSRQERLRMKITNQPLLA